MSLLMVNSKWGAAMNKFIANYGLFDFCSSFKSSVTKEISIAIAFECG